MKAVVAAFNQEKALVGAFSVITNLRMEVFEALVDTRLPAASMARRAARAVTVMKTGAETGKRKRWRLPATSGNTP